MGFDNECILNIQSLAGEYFCPVCRLLVHPNEALQSQCTHLYCKPCLTYVVSTTRACPYDGFLVTEADSKPLVESNKALAETIGKIAVHCLYHRSGCTWQGQLAECTSHCATCPYGNSPVVCNRCGTQIVHCQVQEHAQNCPGVQPQAQQADVGQDSVAQATAVSAEQKQSTSQVATQASQAQPSQVAAAPSSGQVQTQVNVNAQSQNATQAVPTAEQWFQHQQQFQQYYQQYPGYDPSQQYYQSYDPYQQQAYQQYQQQLQAHHPYPVQAQHQPQVYMQPQPQPQPQPAQPQPQPQPQPPPQPPSQPRPQLQVQPQSQVQPQIQPQPQVQVQPQVQNLTQAQPQVQNLTQAQPQGHVLAAGQPQVQAQIIPQPVYHTHPQMQQQPIPPSQGPQHPKLYAQAQPPIPLQPQQVPVQSHPQQRPHLPPHKQPPPGPPQMQHPPPHQLPRPHPGPQPQLPVQPQLQQQTHMQMQSQLQAQSLSQSHPRPQSMPSSVHAVAGPHAYPQLDQQHQMAPGASQPQSMPMHPQSQTMPQKALQQSGQAQPFPPQQLPQMRPPLSHVPMQQPVMQSGYGQQSTMPPAQQPLHSHTQTPGLPAHQHPGMHTPNKQPVQVHAQQVQSFPGQTSSLVHGPPQQSPFVQQQPTMQPPLRPQAPPLSLQQQAPARPHLHQNVPVSHGLLPHQSQNLPGRPLLPNQGLQHQRFHGPPSGTVVYNVKPLQSGAIQPYPPRKNARPLLFSEPQQNSMRPQYRSESAAFQSNRTQVSSEHATITNELKPYVSSQKLEKEKNSVSSHGADSVELKISMSGSEFKSVGTDEKIGNADESNNSASDVKEVSESLQMLEKDHAFGNKEDLEEAKIKVVKDEPSVTLETVAAGIVADPEIKDGESVPFRSRQTESPPQEDKEIQEEAPQTKGPLQKTEVLESADIDAEMPHLGSMDSSVSERDANRVILQGEKSGDKGNSKQAVSLKGDPLQGKMSGQPHGNMSRSQLSLQRPPMPDQILRPSMPPAQKMQVPGLILSHMRPPGNMHGNVPVQGQPPRVPDHFRPPTAKQPPGSFHPDPAGGFVGPGSSSLLGRGPPPVGSAVPRGHFNQGLPSSHATGPRLNGDQMMGPPLAGSALGAFESQRGLIPRGPLHGSEGHIRHPVPANAMESDILGNTRPSYFNARQLGPYFPGSAEHVPFGQTSDMPPNVMKINGGPGKRLASGLQGPLIPFGLREERLQRDDSFKRLPEEGLNMLPGDRLKFPNEPGRNMIDRGEFMGDLKQFPRSAHLDSEVVLQFDSYFKRPLDTSDNPPRLLPPYQTGSLRPFDNPDFLRSASESGRHRIDGLPPIRSSGRDYNVLPTRRWPEDGDGGDFRFFGDLPPHLRNAEPFGPRNLPGHLHLGEPAAAGGFHNRAIVGDAGGLGNLPSQGLESGFGISLPTHGYQKDGGFFDAGDLESFDRSRKRKTGNTGWCRICKVDCETMEGLEMHSQTREHQKKALDMVLSIKKDNTKKPKLSSDDHKSHEDGSKSRNASIENRGN